MSTLENIRVYWGEPKCSIDWSPFHLVPCPSVLHFGRQTRFILHRKIFSPLCIDRCNEILIISRVFMNSRMRMQLVSSFPNNNQNIVTQATLTQTSL